MPRPAVRVRKQCLAIFMPTAVLLAVVLSPGRASADWPSDPLVNLPICVAVNSQRTPENTSDGAGGTIIAWPDLRDGVSYDIYAQRVLASGLVDPAWPVNGRALCTASGTQANVKLVPDGAGGAIVAWTDGRGGAALDLYAQHVLSNGTLDPAWPANGLAVCTADSTQYQLRMSGDGAGGAIVGWTDLRSRTDRDVYATHILAAGTVDPSWPTEGLSVCVVGGEQTLWAMVRDADGSVILVWNDSRGGGYDIYAQRVLSSGVVDPDWPAQGAPVSVYPGDQTIPDAAPDGAGGVLVAWQDFRGGAASDVYSAHLLAEGVVDPTWPPNGRPLCTAVGNQTAVRISEATAGEAIVTWMDGRAGLDIYAQRAGGPAESWPTDGRALCTATGNQLNPSICSDGVGGAIVAWQDQRSGGSDIYAQRVLTNGDVDAAWPLNGRALCLATGTQQETRILADGSGGAIVTWFDHRWGGATPEDIYAQRVQANGQLGGTVVEVPASAVLDFALEPVHPNPSRGGPVSVRFSLAREATASMELLDVSGRRLLLRDLGTLGPGRHAVELATADRIPSGLYFVRVRSGTQSRSMRVAILD